MSPNSSSANYQTTRGAPKQLTYLPNNYSFRFNNKKVRSRNAINGPINQATSSFDEFKIKNQGLEFEMQDIKHDSTHIVRGCTSSISGPSLPHIHHDNQQIDEIKSHDGERFSFRAKSNTNNGLKCKYKVMFKTHSNTDTIVIVNALKTKKQSCQPNIPRCPIIHDLSNVGTLRSVVHITGTKHKRGCASCNSIADERHINYRMFSSSSSAPSSKEV